MDELIGWIDLAKHVVKLITALLVGRAALKQAKRKRRR
jgi:hypothetical protein